MQSRGRQYDLRRMDEQLGEEVYDIPTILEQLTEFYYEVRVVDSRSHASAFWIQIDPFPIIQSDPIPVRTSIGTSVRGPKNEEIADALNAWWECTTDDEIPYYYKKDTRKSEWLIPEELKLAREQAERKRVQGTHPAAAGGPSTFSAPPEMVSSSDDGKAKGGGYSLRAILLKLQGL